MPKADLISLILNKIEEEAKQEGSRPHTLGVYRASELGGCPRAVQYGTLGYKAEIVSPESYLIFQDGHLHHGAVRGLLAKVGNVTNVEMTISKHYKRNGKKFLISGTLDGKFNGIPFDVKSINTFRFKALDKNFPQDYLNYVIQLTIYMDILGATKGFFIFKDKNNAELKIKYIDYDPEMMDKILDIVSAIHTGCLSEELIDKPYVHSDWHCKLCPYRIHCWKLPMESKHWTREHAKDARKRAEIAELRETLKGE